MMQAPLRFMALLVIIVLIIVIMADVITSASIKRKEYGCQSSSSFCSMDEDCCSLSCNFYICDITPL